MQGLPSKRCRPEKSPEPHTNLSMTSKPGPTEKPRLAKKDIPPEHAGKKARTTLPTRAAGHLLTSGSVLVVHVQKPVTLDLEN